MPKKVPLVTYENGERIVIGEAEVADDGTATLIVNDSVTKKLFGRFDAAEEVRMNAFIPLDPSPESFSIKPFEKKLELPKNWEEMINPGIRPIRGNAQKIEFENPLEGRELSGE